MSRLSLDIGVWLCCGREELARCGGALLVVGFSKRLRVRRKKRLGHPYRSRPHPFLFLDIAHFGFPWLLKLVPVRKSNTAAMKM